MKFRSMQAAMLIGIAAVALATASMAAQLDAANASKINTLLNRWQVVEANKGGDVAVWRDMMSIQLNQVAPSTLDKLLAISTGSNPQVIGEFYQTFIYTLGTDIALRLRAQSAGQVTAQAQVVKSAASDTPSFSPPATGGANPNSLGSTGIDQTFTPITPCRVVDTRNLGGTIGAFATRNFFFYTTSAATNWNTIQGGVNGAAGTVCPGTVITGFVPSAAVATITVTGQGGAGNLIVWQGTSPVASASTMSYFASGDIAVLAVIPGGGRSGTGPGGSVQDFGVFVNAFTPTNVVVDIVGYYTQPAATALDCVQTAQNSVSIANNGVINFNVTAACPAGYTQVSLNCRGHDFFNGTQWLGFGNAQPDASAECQGFNASGATQLYEGSRTCCRVPGH